MQIPRGKAGKTPIAEVTHLIRLFNPLTAVIGQPFLAKNRQSLELESCSNPPRIKQVFQLRSKKTFFIFGLAFSGGDVTMRACFQIFGHLYLALNPLTHSFESEFS